MNSAPTIPAVVRSVTVQATLEHAFHTFTAAFGSWWPAGYHIGTAEMAEAILEQRTGGRWYERGTDGTESDWGTVLAWEPPNRLVLGWQIDGTWQYDPDPAHASEIEIRFDADGPTQTVVSVEHRYLDRVRHPAELSDAVGGDGGWTTLLARFAEAAQAA